MTKLSASSLAGSSAGRPPEDYYITPDSAIEALLDHETFHGSIWDNSCGSGAISEVLKKKGYSDVLSSDLMDRGYGIVNHDFLTSPHKADNICMNPPFRYAKEFVELSLQKTTRKVAMLGKIQFLEGINRTSLFDVKKLETVYVFRRRVNFYRNGVRGNLSTSTLCFAWYVWNHEYYGKPSIDWI